MPVTINTIPRSEVVYGKPQPSDNYCLQGASFIQVGIESFELTDFPANQTPSGGTSCRISTSEMVMLRIKMTDYSPKNDSGIYTLYRINEFGQMTQLGEKVITPDFQEDPNWTTYFSYDYAFFGHFDHEINQAGNYAIEAVYPQGTVRWEFRVTNSTQQVVVSNVQVVSVLYDYYRVNWTQNVAGNVNIKVDNVLRSTVSGVIGENTYYLGALDIGSHTICVDPS